MATPSYGEPVPSAAKQFQRSLTREAHAFWGLNAPIALFAGQIHQESLWRPGVSSRFASGLTQFTDSTAEWIAEVYPNQLGGPDVFNPEWSIRAMVLYDLWLYERVPEAASEYDRWAFTLSSYNGGLGWVKRDVRLCDAAPGCDPEVWFGNVERHSSRADWAIEENRGYIRILTHRQYIYNTWGLTVEVDLEPVNVQCTIRLFN
jgi:membrane-bound lytic murein transglycosylase MltF